MTTAREHMLADMQWLFAQEGEEARDVVIDGSPARVITGEIKTEQVEDGSWFEIFELTALQSELSAVPRQVLDIDGVKYTVDAVRRDGVLLILGLVRPVA